MPRGAQYKRRMPGIEALQCGFVEDLRIEQIDAAIRAEQARKKAALDEQLRCKLCRIHHKNGPAWGSAQFNGSL